MSRTKFSFSILIAFALLISLNAPLLAFAADEADYDASDPDTASTVVESETAETETAESGEDEQSEADTDDETSNDEASSETSASVDAETTETAETTESESATESEDTTETGSTTETSDNSSSSSESTSETTDSATSTETNVTTSAATRAYVSQPLLLGASNDASNTTDTTSADDSSDANTFILDTNVKVCEYLVTYKGRTDNCAIVSNTEPYSIYGNFAPRDDHNVILRDVNLLFDGFQIDLYVTNKFGTLTIEGDTVISSKNGCALMLSEGTPLSSIQIKSGTFVSLSDKFVSPVCYQINPVRGNTQEQGEAALFGALAPGKAFYNTENGQNVQLLPSDITTVDFVSKMIISAYGFNTREITVQDLPTEETVSETPTTPQTGASKTRKSSLRIVMPAILSVVFASAFTLVVIFTTKKKFYGE